jgi:hypothetical protein
MSAAPAIAIEDDVDFAVECWAQRLLARSVLCLDGVLDRQTAIDGIWQAAIDAGLVDEFGADEIQAAMALAFGAPA